MRRREALTLLGAFTANMTASPFCKAIEPFQRKSLSPLRSSLAAYSLRDSLPDTRRDPKAIGRIDLLGFIDYAATLGIDAVELTSYYMPMPLTAEYINLLKRRTHLNGLDISGGAIGNNFSHAPNSDTGKEQMAYVRYWIDQYAMLGAPVIRIFGGKPERNSDEKQDVENIIANVTTACEYAGQKGVMLAIENHDYLVEIDRFLKVVKAIDSPWFGVNFDSGNLAPTNDPYGELERIAPYAVSAQIKTTIMVGEEEQPADFLRIVQILRKSNYQGYITLEYEEAEDPTKAIPKYLAKLQRAISS